jgi:hypothetical protein
MKLTEFKGETKELEEIISLSWPLQHQSHIRFSDAYLQFLLNAPGVSAACTLGAYHDGHLVSFLLSKHCEIMMDGNKYSALLSSMASTRPGYEGAYLGLRSTCLKKASKLGYAFSYGFTAHGISNNEIERLIAENLGYTWFKIASFHPLIALPRRVLNCCEGEPVQGIEISDFHKRDIEQCLNIIEARLKGIEFYGIPLPSELLYNLADTPFNKTFVVKKGSQIQGFINVRLVEMCSNQYSHKSCIVYNLFIDNLTLDEKKYAIRSLASYCIQNHIEGISIPNTGYFDVDDIKSMGFREYTSSKNITNLTFVTLAKNGFSNLNGDFYLEIV